MSYKNKHHKHEQSREQEYLYIFLTELFKIKFIFSETTHYEKKRVHSRDKNLL